MSPTTQGALRARVAARLAIPAEELPAIEVKEARHRRPRWASTLPPDALAARPERAGPGRAAARARWTARAVSSWWEMARPACSAPTSSRAHGIGCIVARPRQAGAAAPPRPQGPAPSTASSTPTATTASARAARARTSDGKLYTRAHKRGDVRDVLELLAPPRRAGRHPRRRAPAHRLEQAAQGDHARCASASSELGVTFRFGARVVGLGAAPRGAARIGVRLADGSELDGERRRARHRPLGARRLRAARRRGRAPRGQAVRARRAHRAPAAADQPHPVRPRRRAPEAARARLSPRVTTDERARRVLVLHVPGRLHRARGHRARRPGGQRHEPVAARLALRELGPRGLGRARRPRARGLPGTARRHRVPARHRASRQARRRRQPARARHARDRLREGPRLDSTPDTSYQPGLLATNIARCSTAGALASPRACPRAALFDRQMRGYVTEDAVLVGVESRTSSPVRVPATRAARVARLPGCTRPAKARATPAASCARRSTASASRARSRRCCRRRGCSAALVSTFPLRALPGPR